MSSEGKDIQKTSVETPYGWVVVATSLLLMTIAAGAYFVVIVGLKFVAEEFGGVRWVPSLAYSGAIFGMGLGGIFFGLSYARLGVALPALIGSLMVPLGAYLAGSTTNRWTFLVAHAILMGLVGNAALFSPLLAHATRWFDRRRGMAVAIVASSQGLAGMIWPPIYRVMLETSTWRDIYRAYAAFAFLTLVPLSLLLWPRAPAPIVSNSSGADGSSRRVLGLGESRATVLLSAAIVSCCVAMAMPIVHIVAHVTDLGHPLVRAAEVLSVLLGSAFVGRIVWGIMADRIGGLRVLMMSSAFQAASLAMYAFVENLPALYGISVCFGVAFGGIIPCYTLIIGKYFPPMSVGWRVATVYLFGAIGMAIGGWLGGFLFDLSGSYRGAFAVGLLFNVVNLAIVGSLLAREIPRLRPVNA